ncbi:hypothetical protein A6R68_05861, partial [Neotoma lepida]
FATHNKLLERVKTMNEKPIISRKVITIFQEQDSANIK